MKWYRRFGVQIAIVSVFALMLGFSLFVVFRSNDIFGSLSDSVSAAISTLGALSVGGIAVIQLRRHKIYEEQAELDRKVKEKQLDALEEDRVVKKKQLDAQQSDRFTKSIDHLKDESLAIRMGALYELKRLGLHAPEEDQKNIVRILSSFVREHIEDKTYWKLPNKDEPDEKNWLPAPKDDVYLAGEILSYFYWKNNDLRASLSYLNAKGLYLGHLELCGADLKKAIFRGAKLHHAKLQESSLIGADLQKSILLDTNLDGADFGAANSKKATLQEVPRISANLYDAHFVEATLRNARNLTVEQLLSAHIDDITITQLDPELRDDPRVQGIIKSNGRKGSQWRKNARIKPPSSS